MDRWPTLCRGMRVTRSDGGDFHLSLSFPLGMRLTLPAITELPASLSSLNSQQKYLLSSGQRQDTLEGKPKTFGREKEHQRKQSQGQPQALLLHSICHPSPSANDTLGGPPKTPSLPSPPAAKMWPAYLASGVFTQWLSSLLTHLVFGTLQNILDRIFFP